MAREPRSTRAGTSTKQITVPGALEIPGAIAQAALSGRYYAFVALGVVIRGETYHFEIVGNESARALMALTLDGYAVGNGILTVENEAQAIARADPAQGDKGGGAAKAALAMLDIERPLRRRAERSKSRALGRFGVVERRVIDIACGPAE